MSTHTLTWLVLCAKSETIFEWLTDESRISHEWVTRGSRMSHKWVHIYSHDQYCVSNVKLSSNDSRMSHEWVTNGSRTSHEWVHIYSHDQYYVANVQLSSNESRMSHEWVTKEYTYTHLTSTVCGFLTMSCQVIVCVTNENHVLRMRTSVESRMSHEWITNETRMSQKWVHIHSHNYSNCANTACWIRSVIRFHSLISILLQRNVAKET